jgi:lipoprotein NlpI
MMKVYAMFRGEAEPADVLAEARAGDPPPEELNTRLFYAHLYIGLFHEAQGDTAASLAHVAKAAREHPVSHYMWDVARVHVELREAAVDAEPPTPP